jgi:hypothetical protein
MAAMEEMIFTPEKLAVKRGQSMQLSPVAVEDHGAFA